MRIRDYINRLDKKTKLLFASFAAVAAIAVPVVVNAGFGPDRPVFDWNNPDDRKGSLTGPVFNSFINTPTYGDERNFVRIADVVPGQSPVEADFRETETAEAGKEYWVRTFVHNNANQATNSEDKDNDGHPDGVARNTRVSIDIADGTANGVDVLADITADNATPNKVWDTATLANDQRAFSVSYVNGSASLYNPAHQAGLALPDSIANGGTQIGYDAMNGNLPGCFEFSAYIYIKVKVTAPDLQIDKRVSKVEAPKLTDSSEVVTAKRGETVTWRIDYKNTGTQTVNDITIRDQIPAGLTLVPGSITWIDVNHQNGETLQDTALGSGGVNVGNYAANGNGVIRFRTTINNDVENCEIKNVAFGRAENVPEQSDDAKVVIEDCAQTQPIYRCELLKAEMISDRAYRFTTETTAIGGATVKQYRYKFGDNTDELVTDQKTVEHTFPASGDFVTTVTVDFNVDGQVKSHTSDKCKVAISIKPGQPTVLPSTGPADLIGVFAATTFAGAIAHKVVWSRRGLL